MFASLNCSCRLINEIKWWRRERRVMTMHIYKELSFVGDKPALDNFKKIAPTMCEKLK